MFGVRRGERREKGKDDDGACKFYSLIILKIT
jgi:hypothetical protein